VGEIKILTKKHKVKNDSPVATKASDVRAQWKQWHCHLFPSEQVVETDQPIKELLQEKKHISNIAKNKDEN
jgi:hypothetical protein